MPYDVIFFSQLQCKRSCFAYSWSLTLVLTLSYISRCVNLWWIDCVSHKVDTFWNWCGNVWSWVLLSTNINAMRCHCNTHKAHLCQWLNRLLSFLDWKSWNLLSNLVCWSVQKRRIDLTAHKADQRNGFYIYLNRLNNLWSVWIIACIDKLALAVIYVYWLLINGSNDEPTRFYNTLTILILLFSNLISVRLLSFHFLRC